MPYLAGERSPHNDVSARGAFVGMGFGTTRQEMTLSILEGVAFALRDCLEVMKRNGARIQKARIAGGGAKSPLWQKIIANVLQIEIEIPSLSEGPSFGAAILAMVAAGAYPSLEAASERLSKVATVVLPSSDLGKAYEERYLHWRRLYPALRDRF